VLPDALFAIEQRRIVALAALHRMPALYPARSFVEAGGLMALSGNAGEVIRRAAAVVARVLAGARPASLPVEALAPLVLTVNAEAARAIGLAMPRSLLARADAVIRA
jgi:putative ABC transport system substrate-binding protein